MKRIIKPGILALAIFTTITGFTKQNLLIQSNSYEGEGLFEEQQKWLKEIEKESNGQVSFHLVSAGDAVFYTETLDAMRLGVLDGHFSALGYFSGKDPGIALLSNVVGAWSNADEFIRFMYDGGGNDLLSEYYSKHNVHLIGSLTTGLEAFVSKVPVDGVADLKGLRIRVPDDMVARVFAAAGAEPVNLPGDQVIPALNSGVIEASDYSVLTVNQGRGMNDIAPNPVYPGFHSVPTLDFSLSQEKWNLLPSDVRNLLTSSIRDFAEKTADKFKKEDLEVVARIKNNPNITIHDWSPEERKKFRTIAQQQWKIVSNESPLAEQVYELVINFLTSNRML